MFWTPIHQATNITHEVSRHVSRQTMKYKHSLDKNSTSYIKRNKTIDASGFWSSRRHQVISYSELSRARRRRLATSAQRKAANVREQQRMMNLKDAFRTLKECLPVLSYKKRMSRIETLRLAIVYIKFLQKVVNGENDDVTSTVLRSPKPRINETSTQ